MNTVGEVIDTAKASCREFDPRGTLQVLRGTNPIKFMCWGASKFTVDNMKAPKMLRFYVRGRKHTGHVYIFLNGSDLYDVYIVTSKGTIKDRSDEMGLYFDQITEWIDEKIEKVENYTF